MLRKLFITFYIIVLYVVSAVAQEAAQIYFSAEEMPDLLRILPPPPDSTSSGFAHDMMRYMWGKYQRNDLERSDIAVRDAEYSLNRIISEFSEPFGMSISFEETPEIYRLLRDFTATCDNICVLPKNHYMRIRPFMMFHEHTITPNKEDEMVINGSYPSGHTTYGWGVAMILSEINPQRIDTLMARGYMFGESRVIVGAHWQSDVDAGYLAASVLYTKLHTNLIFLEQMAKARQEFADKTSSLSVNSANSRSESSSKVYNLSGIQLPREPSKGIYIQSGKKYSAK